MFWILLSIGKRYSSGTGIDAASAGIQDMSYEALYWLQYHSLQQYTQSIHTYM